MDAVRPKREYQAVEAENSAYRARLATAENEIVLLRSRLRFLITEITDLEGREGMTDYDFAEQIIALAQAERTNLSE